MEVELMSWMVDTENCMAKAMKGTRGITPAHKLLMSNKCTASDGSCETCRSQTNFMSEKEQKQHCSLCFVHWLRLAKTERHWGVFEDTTMMFSVSGVSRALTHQLVRHRIASYKQQSQRHVDPTKMPEWFIVPETIMSLDKHAVDVNVEEYLDLMDKIAAFYGRLVKAGVPEEDARFILPNACKTNITITMNGRSLLHFFRLRLDKHAQWEIRELATKMLEVLQEKFPFIFEGAGELDV